MATFSALDHRFMSRALELAERGLMTTDPNPRVGCVIARDGEALAEAWHERVGEPHAEVLALRAAGARARDATLYVTLEPCSHQGRTPPCTDAVLAAGISRVVCAMVDPNPLVRGAGIARLEAAGLKMECGLLSAEAEALNCGFVQRMRRGTPWVRLKFGASLDGRTALSSGASRWITGEAAREDVQRWRARSSAVLTGSGTILTDDPRLDVRLPGAERQPLRVVLASSLDIPATARVLERPGEVLVFTATADASRRAALESRGARVEAIGDNGKGGLDLRNVLSRLAELEANEVWVECGPRLAGALMEHELVNELVLYVAPHVLGSGARGMFELQEPASLEQRRRFEYVDVRRIGEDVRLIARPVS